MKRGTLIALLAGLLLAASGSSAAPTPPAPEDSAQAATTRVAPAARAKKALRRLVRDTRALPAKRNAPVKPRLLQVALSANRGYRRNPCGAVQALRQYRGQLGKVKGQRRRAGASWQSVLRTDAFAADAALKTMKNTKRCGGGARPPADDLTVSVLRSDVNGMKLRVALPEALFVAEQGGGKSFTQMLMDGMGDASVPGQPGVPSASKLFALPPGMQVRAKFSNVSSYTLEGVNLFPEQNQPVDQAGGPPIPVSFHLDTPFVQNKKAYRSASPFPQKPANAANVGTMRDLQLGGVDVAGGQYRPRQRQLRVFTGMDVELQFVGSNPGYFAGSRLADPFNVAFNRIYKSSVLNYAAVVASLQANTYPYCGEELLIITSTDLRPAANTLAASRAAAGYLTAVREVGAGAGQIGTTNTEIQAYIRSRLSANCLVRPSYFILLGNTAHVPTFLVPCAPGGDPAECNIASDLPYALDGVGSDYLADIAYGRISAPDLATANTVVNKIITYETTPPAPPADPFYRSITVTAFFEYSVKCVLNNGETGTPNCDSGAGPVNGHKEIDPAVTQDARGFTKTAETVRDGMLDYGGLSVERLYNTIPEVNPLTFHDGTPMPAAILRPGFAWDAEGPQLVNAFNDGRTIIFHRDHGWPAGWAHPTISEGDLPSLTNGTQLPVVFGINCSSAAYDTPADPSFVELLIQKADGGAIGGFGDSRVSGTWSNNRIARGLFDAIFPDVVPSYGSPVSILRMGDVLLAGKQYFESVDGAYSHHHLYGYFGDPTMQLWIAEPLVFDPSKIVFEIVQNPIPGGDPPFWVRATMTQPGVEGTIATLRYRDEVVGRAIVENGVALIPALGNAANDALDVAFEQDGFIPTTRDVPP